MDAYGYRAARAVMLKKFNTLRGVIEASRDEWAAADKAPKGRGQPRKRPEWLAATKDRLTSDITVAGLEWAARPRDSAPKRFQAALELGASIAPTADVETQVAIGLQMADMLALAGVIESLNPPLGKHRDMAPLELTREIVESVEPFFDAGPTAPLLEPVQGPPRIRPNWRHGHGARIKGPLVGQTLDIIRATRWAINPHMLAVFDALYPKMKGSRLTLLERAALHQARKLDGAFYFDSHFDYRGRVYQDGLNGLEWTNASDKTRSLLEFADGFPVGLNGDLFYLELHITSTWGQGVDKQPDADRSAWVEAHKARILGCVNNAKPGAFWRRAKEPFRFLAACVAYRDALAGEPVHLPVSFDVTCSGAGIYSLLVRDYDLAQRVGIVPGNAGGPDFYQHFGSLCDPPLNRAAAKDFCAGAFYGTTDGWWPMSDKGAAFWRAMGPDARHLYLWLRSRCYLGDVVSWTLPDGFEVNQSYRRWFATTVSARVGRRVIKLERQQRGPDCDVAQMVDGIAANFVHSWDGAYLRAVVRTGNLLGIPSWGLAHDCFSVHPWAARMLLEGALPSALKEVFEPDRLAELGWSGAPGCRGVLPWPSKGLGPIVG